MPNFQFRLMVTSDTDSALAYNLERRLMSVQNIFPFRVHDESLTLPDDDRPTTAAGTLEKMALDLARTRYHRETPVLITSRDIDDGSFSSFDDTVAVISVKHWSDSEFSPWPVSDSCCTQLLMCL